MYQNILVAIDGSDTSKLGLREAIKLANGHRASLRLVHVINASALAMEYAFAVTGDLLERLRGVGQAALDEAQSIAEKAGLQAECILIEAGSDNTGELLVKQAAEWPADIIVMGTHGRRGLSRLFLGSNAEYVLRHAGVPALLVRA